MSRVALLVDEGMQLRAQISALEDNLECIEAELRQLGLDGEQVDLADADREGKQFLAVGSQHIVPVVFTADLLVNSFADKSAVHTQIEAAAGGKLKEFYRSKTTWGMLAKDGKKFRSQAAELLGDKAPAFITACVARDKFGIAKSNIKVEWDRATGKEAA